MVFVIANKLAYRLLGSLNDIARFM